MRRALSLTAFAVVAVVLVHCSGSSSDDSNPITTSDAGSDATIGDGSIGDGSAGNDGAPSTDAGKDAATPPPNDECVGHTDCPNNIDAASLKLWLRGNIGVTCVGERVAAWKDQSGNSNDPQIALFSDGGAAYAPECTVDKINAHDVVSFMAPPEPDAGFGGEFTEFVDETLSVNLGFLDSAGYTVFIVHHRSVNAGFGLLADDRSIKPGTIAPLPCFHFVGNPDPNPYAAIEYDGLTDGGFGLGDDHYCVGSYSTTNTFTGLTTDVDELIFSSTTGHRMLTNGVAVFTGAGDADDLVQVTNDGTTGVLGRSFSRYNSDTRYSGDIAEIIAFNSTLTDAQRGQIEAYLKRQWALTF